jgi:hypothetical protein
MKIKYSKQRLKSNLKLGLFFLIMGIVLTILSVIVDGNDTYYLDSVGIGQICTGLLILIIYFFERRKQYLTIENGLLVKNSFVPKKINLTEIKWIQKFAGDYKLKTDKEELTIDTQIIDKYSLTDLNTELNKLNLTWK